MRISNVGLFVKDLEGARKFFEDFFGAQVHATYEKRMTATSLTS